MWIFIIHYTHLHIFYIKIHHFQSGEKKLIIYVYYSLYMEYKTVGTKYIILSISGTLHNIKSRSSQKSILSHIRVPNIIYTLFSSLRWQCKHSTASLND